MKTQSTLFMLGIAAIFFTACKKEGDTINNYYSTTTDVKLPPRKLMKEYGLADSSQVIRFTFINNDPSKLKELISSSMGVPATKFTVLYNASNQPEGYQSFTLPANTLNEQGTYKLDGKGRITEVIKRKPNGDTIGISSYSYASIDFQPVTFTYYDKSFDRIVKYEFFYYDIYGNMTRMTSYSNNGTDPVYKSSEVETSVFTKAINPLNQLTPYLISSFGSYGFSNSGPLYFSLYFPASSIENRFKIDGSSDGSSVSSYKIETDTENFITSLTSGSQVIFVKY